MPERDREPLVFLAKMNDADFSALAAAMAAQPLPEVARPTSLVEAAAAAVPALDTEAIALVLDTLFSLISGRDMHSDPAGRFIEGVAASDQLELTNDERSTLVDRLTTTLALPVVSLLGKALDITTEQQRLFHASRIFTDIRPVFADDVDQPPTTAVVFHTLKVDYIEDGRLQDLYVAMDQEDLQGLKMVVDRAIRKHESLRQYLDAVGFHRMDPTADE